MARVMMLIAAVAMVLSMSASLVVAADYYVDYAGGLDSNSGTSAQSAFKHSPGDRAARENAAGLQLAPGDRVFFKGGVRYSGSITVTASGEADRPIIFDGNTEGKFGEGLAIIDGGVPLTGWKRCASAAEAGGNANWAQIYYVDVPRALNWRLVNLSAGETPLPISQDPNPSDALFQEDPSDYYVVDGRMPLDLPAKIYAESGTGVNSQRPLVSMITPGGSGAVVSPVIGASFSVEVPQALTVKSVGISMLPNYTAVKEVAFYGDGQELCRVVLEQGKRGLQTFDLPAAATFSKFTVKLLSTFEPVKSNWTAIAAIAALDAEGKNLLHFDANLLLTDAKVLRQKDASYYDGMTVGFHGGANTLIYRSVEKYDPAANRLYLQNYTGNQYNQTRYCLLNSVRLIDVPGEYSVELTGDGKTSRIYLMPDKVVDGEPAAISMSQHGNGFLLQRASHVTVQGFRILRQGNTSRNAGLSANGPAEGVTFRDCEVTLVRGTAITTFRVNKVLVDNCFVHTNPGHSKGIVLREGDQVTTRNSRLVRNTSTALDYYTCTNGVVTGCVLEDNRGMHANGLTFYLGCKNLLIEGNRVSRGNAAITFQQAENVVIRNNVFDSNGRSTVVGIWPGQPLKNVEIINNTIVGSNHGANWATGLFTNSKNIQGLVVKNNIIDGLCGMSGLPEKGVFANNLYTRLGPDRESKEFAPGEFFESDLQKIFVDAENGDYRLRRGSPAIGAGAAVDVEHDFSGRARPRGAAVSIGAYEGAAE